MVDHSLKPSPIKIDVDFPNPATGFVSATVTMYSTTANLVNESFHIVLIEDDVAGDNTHITRAIYNDQLTLTGQWATASFSTTFTIDPTWNTSKLRAVAFVQQADKEILQAGSSDPHAADMIRAMVPFSRVEFGPSSGYHESDWLTVMNVGDTGSFTADVVVDHAPPGWTTSFKDSTGTVHTSSYDFPLTYGDSTTFKVGFTANGAGYLSCRLVISSPALDHPLEVPFLYYTDDADVMVVDDDGGQAYEDYFTAALDTAGVSYGVWNRLSYTLPAEVATYYDTLVWNGGWTSTTFDVDDRLFVGDHLDNGHSLFVTGQDIGWEMNDPAASPTPAETLWYETYLKADYIRDDTNILYLDGVPGDQITDGLNLHIAGGDGANNQAYPDEIAPIDADATEILTYTGGYCGAIRSEDSLTGAKVVYLAFGFEAIDNPQDRHDMLIPAIAWLQQLFGDGFESSDTSAWSSTAP